MQSFFPAVQPNQLIPGLPHRPPFIPQLQTRGQMGELVAPITGHLIDDLQKNANASVLRQALYYHMSPNFFNNPDFIGMVADTVDYAEMLIYERGMAPQQAIPQVITEMAQMLSALETQRDSRLYGVLDQNTQTLVGQWIAHYNGTAAQIQNYLNRVMQPMQQGMYGQQPMQQPGYGQYPGGVTIGAPIYQQPQQQQMHQPYFQQQTRVQGGVGGVPTGGRNSGMPNLAMNTHQMAPTPTNQTTQPPAGTRSSVSPVEKQLTTFMGGNTPIKETGMTPQPVQIIPPQQQAPDGYIQQLREYFMPGEAFPEGVDSIPLVFLLEKHVAFIKTEKGVPTNFVIDMDQCTMKYEQHKCEHLLRGRFEEVRNATPEIMLRNTAFERMQQQRSIEDMLKSLEDKLAEEAIEVDKDLPMVMDVRITHPLLLSSSDYHNIASGYIEEQNVKPDFSESVISYTGVTFAQWAFTDNNAAILKQCASVTTHLELRRLLHAVKMQLPLRNFDQIDRMVTEYFNERLKIDCGLYLRLDSYYDDIIEMMGCIEADHPVALPIVNTHVLNRLKKVTLDVDNTELYTEAHQLTEPIPVSVLAVIEDITLIPVTSTDLNLGCLESVGRMIRRLTPELYACVETRFQLKHPRARFVKLITLDAQIVYCYQSCEADSFLLSAMQIA